MGLFENKRFTVISISVLVILNLILIGFITVSAFDKRDRNRKGSDDRRAEYIAKKLGFSDTQKEAYDSLNTQHRNATDELQRIINDKRREVFSLTREENNSPEVADSLTSEIGILVSKMEFRTYEHVLNVRALCTPEQLETLDSLVQAMIKSRRPKKEATNDKVPRNLGKKVPPPPQN